MKNELHDPNVFADRVRAQKIPHGERCQRCDGTGNEFYRMYRKCSHCDGTGRAQTNERKEA